MRLLNHLTDGVQYPLVTSCSRNPSSAVSNAQSSEGWVDVYHIPWSPLLHIKSPLPPLLAPPLRASSSRPPALAYGPRLSGSICFRSVVVMSLTPSDSGLA